jgi:hypothetical protein
MQGYGFPIISRYRAEQWHGVHSQNFLRAPLVYKTPYNQHLPQG